MTTFKRSAVLFVGFVGLSAGSALAEDSVVARVPFPFTLQGEEFPAGHYRISDEGNILTVRGTDNRQGAFALAIPADGRDPAGSQPALVFTRDGNEYRLSQIWESDTEGQLVVKPPVVERHAEGDHAAAGAPMVVLAERAR